MKYTLDTAETFEQLADIAVSMLKEQSFSEKPIVEICGPISTGGLGNLEKNLSRIKTSIAVAQKHGLEVFNNAPFEGAMKRIAPRYPLVDGYCVAILEIFYRRIFESGFIKKALFLPDWQSSRGARWERTIAAELGIEVIDYPKEWLSEVEAI